jgi:hypothetical protein
MEPVRLGGWAAERASQALAVPEGLSPSEAGKGLEEHIELLEEQREKRRDEKISIVEASMLAIVD